jgi:CRISP-associated protein Cas1
MLKRSLFFVSPARLSLRDGQLVFKGEQSGESRTVPVEDIGVVILENQQISLSLPLLTALNANNVAVVLCDEKHMPASMLLNLDGHSVQTELFAHQMKASEPLKKNLWKQTIEAKIQNQAALLRLYRRKDAELMTFARDVKSGDTTNREGAAARIYWKRLFGSHFERDRYGDTPNNLLNYGYIILRSAITRGLCGSGLLPTLGIHHHNRYNSFCLADDIMEPYRPFVDRQVFQLFQNQPELAELTTPVKLELVDVLSTDVLIDKLQRPLLVAISQTTASLARCFAGTQKRIIYPVLPDSIDI